MKSALIVGNSDGIGLALTRRLLDDGWRVAGVSRSAVDLTGERHTHRVADVTDPGFAKAATEAADALETIDLVVYAAGVGEFLNLDDLSGQTRMLDVNLMGAARTMEAVVPRMVAAGRGHIIVLSSLADAAIGADAPAYSASKAGLSSYLGGLTIALRPRGVDVTVVRFGFVDTKMAMADTKPMMISVEKAVEVLTDAIRRRPAVVSHPRVVSAAVRMLSAVAALQRRRRRRLA